MFLHGIIFTVLDCIYIVLASLYDFVKFWCIYQFGLPPEYRSCEEYTTEHELAKAVLQMSEECPRKYLTLVHYMYGNIYFNCAECFEICQGIEKSLAWVMDIDECDCDPAYFDKVQDILKQFITPNELSITQELLLSLQVKPVNVQKEYNENLGNIYHWQLDTSTTSKIDELTITVRCPHLQSKLAESTERISQHYTSNILSSKTAMTKSIVSPCGIFDAVWQRIYFWLVILLDLPYNMWLYRSYEEYCKMERDLAKAALQKSDGCPKKYLKLLYSLYSSIYVGCIECSEASYEIAQILWSFNYMNKSPSYDQVHNILKDVSISNMLPITRELMMSLQVKSMSLSTEFNGDLETYTDDIFSDLFINCPHYRSVFSYLIHKIKQLYLNNTSSQTDTLQESTSTGSKAHDHDLDDVFDDIDDDVDYIDDDVDYIDDDIDDDIDDHIDDGDDDDFDIDFDDDFFNYFYDHQRQQKPKLSRGQGRLKGKRIPLNVIRKRIPLNEVNTTVK